MALRGRGARRAGPRDPGGRGPAGRGLRRRGEPRAACSAWRRSAVGNSPGSPIATPGSSARADRRRRTSSPWTRAPGWCTSPPGTARRTTSCGRQLGLEPYTPVDDDGRFTAEVGAFAGLTVWDANPGIIEPCCRERGLLAAEVPFDHTYPHCWRCKKPIIFRATEQWFISLDRRTTSASGPWRPSTEVTWIPRWGEERIYDMVEHRPGLVHLAPARLGRAHRGLLLRGVRGAAARRGGDRARGGHLPGAGRGPTSGSRAGGRAPAPGDALRRMRRRRLPQGDATSSTSGSIPGEPRRRAGDAAGAALARRPLPGGLRPAPRAGSTRRCWRRVGTRDAPPYKRCSPTASWWTATGGRCPSPWATSSPPGESCPSTAPRSAAVGGGRGLPGRHPAVPEILNRLADAYRRIRNTYPLPAGQPRRLRSRARSAAVRPARRARPLHPGPAGPAGGARARGPTRTTSSTPPSTRCTTSAPSTCPPSTSTS